MTRYRRDHTPGATWFFTVNLADRRHCLLVERIAVLRAAFASVRDRHPFEIESIVVLPDRLHAIWTLPPGDAGYPLRWRLIKAAFARGLDSGEPRSRSRVSAANVASGNVGTGSTGSATRRISCAMSITSTSIR